MRAYVRVLMAVVALAMMSACGGPNVAETVTVPDAEPYRLDNGDQLRITVFGQDAMTGEYTVDGSGNISMPLLAQVQARGLTAQELEGAIGDRLVSEGLLVSPSINVQILTYRPFFILGEVAAPGQFAYIENMTVLTAVAMAGGFTHRANTDGFTVTRKVGNKVIEGRAQRNTLVKPGDVIYVHERIL
ncbi:MAG: polysaccharide biosynthesis/export family protein [Dongiaceae bacterium]